MMSNSDLDHLIVIKAYNELLKDVDSVLTRIIRLHALDLTYLVDEIHSLSNRVKTAIIVEEGIKSAQVEEGIGELLRAKPTNWVNSISAEWPIGEKEDK